MRNMKERVWTEGDSRFPYSVTLWGSDPTKEDNDDCATGQDFATLAEARNCIANMGNYFSAMFDTEPYIMLDGPDVLEVTCRVEALKRRQARRESSDRADRTEFAMQAGMGMGIHAYNDAMGYDSESVPDDYDP